MRLSRRNVLAVGAVGLSAVALAACTKAKAPSTATGTTSSGTEDPTPAASSTPAKSTSAKSPSAAPSTAAGSATPANTVAQLSDIKVGEAISATDPSGARIILARPTTNSVAAFSAVCTHQGCTVAPAGNQLDCPCHGSIFDASSGNVLQGPATRALDKVNITLSGNNIVAT